MTGSVLTVVKTTLDFVLTATFVANLVLLDKVEVVSPLMVVMNHHHPQLLQ